MFATSVGLLMNALDAKIINEAEDEVDIGETKISENEKSSKDVSKNRKSILDRFGEKLKEFLDNA